MQVHEYTFVIDATPSEIWAAMHPPIERRGADTENPRIIEHGDVTIEILCEGDEHGDGLVRHCYFPVPKYLLSGGNGVMISMQGGHFVPIPFATMIDSETGRTRVRLVDIASTRYAIARRYMIRLRRDDFEDAQELAKLASTAKLTPDEFRKQFEYLVAEEPPPLFIDQKGERGN